MYISINAEITHIDITYGLHPIFTRRGVEEFVGNRVRSLIMKLLNFDFRFIHSVRFHL